MILDLIKLQQQSETLQRTLLSSQVQRSEALLKLCRLDVDITGILVLVEQLEHVHHVLSSSQVRWSKP